MFPCLVATIHSGDELAEMAAFRGAEVCLLEQMFKVSL